MVCEKNTHAMTPDVVNERIHISMTMVVPYVVCEKNTHAITLAVVNEKNTQAMTLVDPYVVCEKNTHFNDTGGSIHGL